MIKKKGNRRYKKRYDTKKEGKKKDMSKVKRCPHCGAEMRDRGASDACGGISWKCKNKKCGRTIWHRTAIMKAPIPVIPVNYMNKIRT